MSWAGLTHDYGLVALASRALGIEKRTKQGRLHTSEVPYSGIRDVVLGWGFPGGENLGSPSYCCLVYNCGNHSPWDIKRIHEQIFWDAHWGHKIILRDTLDTHEIFFGICNGIKTDPDMRYTGTSLEKKNGSCREQEMARIAHNTSRGGISAPI